MENISQFLTFVKNYGVPEDEVFQTIDLYESNDPTIVLQTIVSFSRYVHKNQQSIPVIGPKLSTKHSPPKIPKKPKHLNDSKWSSFEYGYIGGANQSNEKVTFGTKRNITKQ
ncbi:Myophilin [Wickerhamomyces ciferrii]|uniref:Myophilin n=1 Tax=Wickerhamomyces ciferrii (strain ATCC 14091 / BCRC 22168 / CBS 111 / JCM 3599 / NBRC 0793 / NRRL Y-1031 F-60-10) TaxID=1206466 RepID=K0KRF3_WICCF|nr:Myophilin [Wickerhamomyces ciferrii]CCH44642.1 Myophilin [Wickerhamomyces ciferrii]